MAAIIESHNIAGLNKQRKFALNQPAAEAENFSGQPLRACSNKKTSSQFIRHHSFFSLRHSVPRTASGFIPRSVLLFPTLSPSHSPSDYLPHYSTLACLILSSVLFLFRRRNHTIYIIMCFLAMDSMP